MLMPLTFGRDVLDEGEFAQLVCIVSKGDEPLQISWALKGDVISSEPSLTTASLGTRTSMLTITSVGYRHSGTYTCTAKNGAGIASQTAELKVNGKSNMLVIGGLNCRSQKALDFIVLNDSSNFSRVSRVILGTVNDKYKEVCF